MDFILILFSLSVNIHWNSSPWHRKKGRYPHVILWVVLTSLNLFTLDPDFMVSERLYIGLLESFGTSFRGPVYSVTWSSYDISTNGLRNSTSRIPVGVSQDKWSFKTLNVVFIGDGTFSHVCVYPSLSLTFVCHPVDITTISVRTDLSAKVTVVGGRYSCESMI